MNGSRSLGDNEKVRRGQPFGEDNRPPAFTAPTTSTMKRIIQLPSRAGLYTLQSNRTPLYIAQRCLHNSAASPATVQPVTAFPGPPPKAPVPSAEHVDSRVARRRKQAELLKRGQDLRAIAGGSGGGTAKTKRFWKDVHVVEAEGIHCCSFVPLVQ